MLITQPFLWCARTTLTKKGERENHNKLRAFNVLINYANVEEQHQRNGARIHRAGCPRSLCVYNPLSEIRSKRLLAQNVLSLAQILSLFLAGFVLLLLACRVVLNVHELFEFFLPFVDAAASSGCC
jgi:hypothetical protein